MEINSQKKWLCKTLSSSLATDDYAQLSIHLIKYFILQMQLAIPSKYVAQQNQEFACFW